MNAELEWKKCKKWKKWNDWKKWKSESHQWHPWYPWHPWRRCTASQLIDTKTILSALGFVGLKDFRMVSFWKFCIRRKTESALWGKWKKWNEWKNWKAMHAKVNWLYTKYQTANDQKAKDQRPKTEKPKTKG